MKLTHLSNSSLLFETKSLAHAERAILSKVLWHLHEVDRRKLYCETKHGSLHVYCIKELKYSEGQASRRVSACRLLKIVPELQQPIEDGSINLTQLGMLSSHMNDLNIKTPDEKKILIPELIKEIKGKSSRETETILRSKTDQKPRKVNLKLEPTTIDKLNEVKALKAHSIKDMDDLITQMSDEVMKLWKPSFVRTKVKETTGESRYISKQTKTKIWDMYEGKCANCGSNYAIQIDHINPISRGGKSIEENLQLLCRNCNQWKGDKKTEIRIKPDSVLNYHSSRI